MEIHFLLRINGGDLGVSVALKVYPSSQNYKQSNSLNCETPPPLFTILKIFSLNLLWAVTVWIQEMEKDEK